MTDATPTKCCNELCDRTDRELREMYAEQASEMRANEIRPPGFKAWKAAIRRGEAAAKRRRESA
jgi:hypothetical protein